MLQWKFESFPPSAWLDKRQRSSDSLHAFFHISATWDGGVPVQKKMAPKIKCKFNEDWMRDFAWIAKLPDNGMAQCNLCATFQYRLAAARMFAVTKRVHARWRMEGLYEGWDNWIGDIYEYCLFADISNWIVDISNWIADIFKYADLQISTIQLEISIIQQQKLRW